MLELKKSLQILRHLPMAKYILVRDEKDLEKMNFPYFMKANVSLHKTEIGGVKKINDLSEARERYKRMKKIGEVIIQQNVEGIEMIIGVKEEKVFGKTIMVGFGGIYAEVNKDVSFRALPITRKDAESMIDELRNKKVLDSRGKKYATQKFVTLIEKIGFLAEKLHIKELDLNPIILNEKEAIIVDARIEI
jgi:hypothetical protein